MLYGAISEKTLKIRRWKYNRKKICVRAPPFKSFASAVRISFFGSFAGNNSREFCISEDFTGINFRESALFKDIAGVDLTFAFSNIFSKTLVYGFENNVSKN